MKNFYLKSCQLLLVAILFVCAWQPSKAQITKMKEGQTVESVLAGSTVQPDNSSENEWTAEEPLRNSSTSRVGTFTGGMQLDLGILLLPKEYDFSFSIEAAMGANYWFHENAYAGIKLGYKGANMSFNNKTKVGKDTYYAVMDMSMHFIHIPVEAGYTIKTKSENFALVPFVGLDFDLGIKGKKEEAYGRTTSNKTKTNLEIGGDMGVGLRLGLRFMIKGYGINCAYALPLNKKAKSFFGEDGNILVGIGF